MTLRTACIARQARCPVCGGPVDYAAPVDYLHPVAEHPQLPFAWHNLRPSYSHRNRARRNRAPTVPDHPGPHSSHKSHSPRTGSAHRISAAAQRISASMNRVERQRGSLLLEDIDGIPSDPIRLYPPRVWSVSKPHVAWLHKPRTCCFVKAKPRLHIKRPSTCGDREVWFSKSGSPKPVRQTTFMGGCVPVPAPANTIRCTATGGMR
jgi:hypothetical protein